MNFNVLLGEWKRLLGFTAKCIRYPYASISVCVCEREYNFFYMNLNRRIGGKK